MHRQYTCTQILFVFKHTVLNKEANLEVKSGIHVVIRKSAKTQSGLRMSLTLSAAKQQEEAAFTWRGTRRQSCDHALHMHSRSQLAQP